MAERQIEIGSKEYSDVINEAYSEDVLKCLDIVERDDFYGIVAARGMRFFGEKLGLTAESHLLDLGSGIGGPARYLARTYGCKVTGVDLSAFNHRTALQRTRDAGLNHLVNFIHGDALKVSFPDESFTHVFGCEAWCYFPDKLRLYRNAFQLLKSGGTIAFLESACDVPVRLHSEELLGAVHYESVVRYAEMLESAAFTSIVRHDTTQLASKDVADAISRLIGRRDRVIDAAGAETYYALLEIWAEFLAHFSKGTLTHCGFVARKTC
jgi:ubiquinone/menaquinone biosynthesis C-methylase UbiE